MDTKIIENPTTTSEENNTIKSTTLEEIRPTEPLVYTPPEVSNDAPTPVHEYVVACGALNVRAEPSLTATIIGRLYEDAYVKCSKINSGWGKIESLNAWVKLEFLTEK